MARFLKLFTKINWLNFNFGSGRHLFLFTNDGLLSLIICQNLTHTFKRQKVNQSEWCQPIAFIILEYIISLPYIQTNYHFESTGWILCLVGVLRGPLDQASVPCVGYQGSSWHIPLVLSTKMDYQCPNSTLFISSTSSIPFQSPANFQSILEKLFIFKFWPPRGLQSPRGLWKL